ncbi:syntabulin isoform X2 [Rhinatrema bivittatum]|uniref:syntabulin isoform X2 n=1 Tax=Rhinatrema bivittatum TaxID=194408 RepID=UPI001126D957|nr:syntabulin isoform X2 [Rhinatrema bivittatum]XP_029447772.1 syntabulin isoform X2 [Rhinatrema bivittatum]
MGPLQDPKKAQEKDIARSRIPRLVLRPYLPKQKISPASESPFSEEESKDFNPSSTISSNSFCSDDTGCPSSQSVSPVKTPSDAGNSPISFCEEDYTRKKANTGTGVDGNIQSARHKKELKACLVKPGSEADFSSSSSTGSISAPEIHMSAAAGSKRSSFSRNRGSHGRINSGSSHKTGSSPPNSREKDLLSVLCRNHLSPVSAHENYGASSASSSNSGSYKGSDTSPTLRRNIRYASCGENHGIKPPSPEQYLTPLQQKEVTIRHLKTKLKDSENRLQERETEIEELKTQLARMRDDWIEEECHRVEAQLALKEARKEIKQLKQVIETMKNSLAEKDKGIQKYFIDINIQNKKLESLLQSMERAQNGVLRDEQCLDYLCGSPVNTLPESIMDGKMSEELVMEDQAAEDVFDKGLLKSDGMANGTDLFDDFLLTTTDESGNLAVLHSAAVHLKHDRKILGKAPDEKSTDAPAEEMLLTEQAIQTDVVPYNLDVENLLLKIFKSHDNFLGASSGLWVSSGFHVECFTESAPALMLDLTPNDPNSAILYSPVASSCTKIDHRVGENRAMKELDFEISLDERFRDDIKISQAGSVKRYWSNSFLVDLLAVAVPIVPTVMWAFSTQRGAIDPVYNIGTMLRGCCLMTLHSLRRMSFNLNKKAQTLH